MAQLMPLALTVSCFSKIQIGFTFLVPAQPGSPGQELLKGFVVVVVVVAVVVTAFSLFGFVYFVIHVFIVKHLIGQ